MGPNAPLGRHGASVQSHHPRGHWGIRPVRRLLKTQVMHEANALICASTSQVRLGIARALREHGGFVVVGTTTAFASLPTMVKASRAQLVISEEFRHGIPWAINVELVGPDGFRPDHGVGWRVDVAAFLHDGPQAAELRFTVLEQALQRLPRAPAAHRTPLRGAEGALQRFTALVARGRAMSPKSSAHSTPTPA